MQPFVPRYFGAFTEDGVSKILIENLLSVTPEASFMDIKLGTSTVTANTLSKGPTHVAKRSAKDARNTSAELGYTIAGFLRKDAAGKTMARAYKMFPPKEKVAAVFRNVFAYENDHIDIAGLRIV